MAGKLTLPSQSEESVIFHWVTEFLFVRTWKEFSESKTLSEDTTDLLHGLFVNTRRRTSHNKEMMDLITIMCRLSDGLDVNMSYGEQSVLNPLEEMLATYQKLLLYQPATIQQTGQELVDVIKNEAVVVCCVAKKFDEAKEVLHRLWNDIDKKDKEKCRMRALLKTMIDDKDTRLLKDYTYDTFLSTMINFLGKIVNNRKGSFLVEMARRYETSHTGDNEADRTRFSKEKVLQSCEKVKDTESKSAAGAEKKKLRKLWQDNLMGMFGTDGGEPETRNSKRLLSPPTATSTPKTSSVTATSTPKTSPFKKPAEPVVRHQAMAKDPSPRSNQSSKTTRQPLADKGDKPASNKVEDWLAQVDFSGVKQRTSPSKRLLPREQQDVEHPAKRFSGHSSNTNQNNRNRHSDPEADMDIEDMSAMSMGSSYTVRTKWTFDEMVLFYCAVMECGVGKWAVIRKRLGTTRTGVMLKDKWRNMEKSGDVDTVREHCRQRKQ